MIRLRIRTAMIGAALLIALSAITSNARAADLQLQSIDVQTLSGQQVQLKFHLSGPAPEPMPFTIDKPARIAFDLPNTAWRSPHAASTSVPAASTRCWRPKPTGAPASS
jgi:type IV pilus assembly protein PilQ